MTNYPTFCQQGALASKGQAEPRRFFRISPNRRPSCRKSGSNAQNMTVRGTSKMQKRGQGTTRIVICQENPRSRISDNEAYASKSLPTYPVQEYFAHSSRKNDNMPLKSTKTRAPMINTSPSGLRHTPNPRQTPTGHKKRLLPIERREKAKELLTKGGVICQQISR